MKGLTLINGTYHATIHYKGQRRHRSTHTGHEPTAERTLVRMQDRRHQLLAGQIVLPPDVDPWDFIFEGIMTAAKSEAAQPSTITIEEFLKAYIASLGPPKISKAFAKTQTIYFSHFTRFMKKTSSLPVALKDWQPQDIEKYRLWRLSPKGWISKKRKVRSITVDKEVGAIRRMFNSARRQGLIEQNPVRDLEVIPDDAPDTTFRTHDEIVALEKAGHLSKKESIELRRKWLLSLNEVEELKALLWRGACQHYMVRPGDLALVIHIAADAGLRLGEINRLTTHEIVLDPEQGTGIITARSRKQSRTVREKERHVPIQGDLIKRLAAWIKGLSGRRLFHECKVDGHYRIDVYRALDAALKGTKFFGIRPHLLRHALRTNMYEAGVDEILIDAYLGHTTREMGDHYRHIRAKRLAAGAQMYAQAQARAASAVASSQTPKPTITLPRPGEAQTESDPNNTTDSAMKYNLHG